jgi:hypothetical protein
MRRGWSSPPRLAVASGAVLLACVGATEPRARTLRVADSTAVVGGLQEAASASVSALRPAVDVRLTVRNAAAAAQKLGVDQRGACDGGVVVRVWRPAANGTGGVAGAWTLAWDSSRRPPILCPGHATPTEIPAGGSLTLGTELAVAEILGDSLPVGRYAITVVADLATPPLPAELTAAVLTLDPVFAPPPDSVLDGAWAGQADGIQLRLALRWTADSVIGAGTYAVFTPNTSRCIPWLAGGGAATLRLHRAGGQMDGVLLVGGAAGAIDGRFHSVDVGTCAFPLGRQ